MSYKKPTQYNKAIDNLTVADMLSLGNDALIHLSEADMKRLVRTTSLAANKRLNRLMAQAKKSDGQYVPKKSAKYNIATDALNWMVSEEKARNGGKGKVERFGVGDKTTKQELQKELSRIRKFMSMKTSTIKGAKDVRKAREKKATGKTREDIIKSAKNKAEQKQMLKTFEENIGDVYKRFREYIEANHPESLNKKWEKYTHFQGSDEVLAEIRFRVASGFTESEDEIEQLQDIEYNAYEQQQIQEQEEQSDWLYGDDDDEGFTYFT